MEEQKDMTVGELRKMLEGYNQDAVIHIGIPAPVTNKLYGCTFKIFHTGAMKQEDCTEVVLIHTI